MISEIKLLIAIVSFLAAFICLIKLFKFHKSNWRLWEIRELINIKTGGLPDAIFHRYDESKLDEDTLRQIEALRKERRQIYKEIMLPSILLILIYSICLFLSIGFFFYWLGID